MTAATHPTDYYELLGVTPEATSDGVRAAYRREARVWHPDHGGSDERMRLLNEAFAVLTDASERRAYDQARAEGAAPAANTAESSAPPVPSVTPDEITWHVDAHPSAPAPISVRLSNRGGPVRNTIEPDRLGGSFWGLDSCVLIMRGEELADFLFVPIDSAAPGTHRDTVRFLVDDQTAELHLTMEVEEDASSRSSSPRPSAPLADGPARPSRVPAATTTGGHSRGYVRDGETVLWLTAGLAFGLFSMIVILALTQILPEWATIGGNPLPLLVLAWPAAELLYWFDQIVAWRDRLPDLVLVCADALMGVGSVLLILTILVCFSIPGAFVVFLPVSFIIHELGSESEELWVIASMLVSMGLTWLVMNDM